MLGALSPDIDFLLMPHGWDRYLVWHEFVTHSVLGTIAPAATTALVVMAGLRRRHAGFGALFAAAWLGGLSHVVLDVVSGGTSQPLWPLAGWRVSLPLASMADPLLGAPLGLFLIASLVWRTRVRAFAAAGAALLVAVLALKGASYLTAREVARTLIGGSGPSLLEAEFGSVRGWHYFDRRDATLRAWRVGVWPASTRLRFTRPVAPESAQATASRTLDTVAHFRRVFDLGFHTERREGGRTTVLWSDIRLCGPDVCALWFGGALDARGRPLEQIVLIGGWRQARAP
jgi:membrane-bound metal-dependent hydrolase YbcI (DUF457 family)